ncbi:hypothetical protein Ssi03_27420 [Sphaerisporangium siamense]|uniref:DUF6745 domain-containing protein n=1 Tax=Sphaerisporangium siamense TaxID=795645 RepID=A0A7W7D417_9ACTN|nr:hypothetical protein [Sphaerisporangium siamense]MBB4699929.1 hypothetical protein [Sphaerisporangium siamense]GII84752.1 hypothetical protein Ssi03_27420 [Sphaerisporangium siamense]
MSTPVLHPRVAAHLADAAAEWDLAAHATGPADRSAAEEGVRAAYHAAGLREPRQIIWFASPAQAATAAVVLSGGAEARAAVRGSALLPPALLELNAGPLVRDLVRSTPWEKVRAEAASALTPTAWAAAWEFVGAGFWPQVNRLVGEIRRGIGRLTGEAGPAPARTAASHVQREPDDPVEGLLRRATLDAVLGQHDAPWLAFFDGLARASLIDIAPLDGVLRVSRAAGWWWPFEHVVLICERPAELRRDDLGRLHHAVGPALAFPDGFGLHAWHGMPVPAGFGATMADLSPAAIRRQDNAELRRVMLEHYGLDRYLRESGADAVHKDDTGVLWKADLADDEPLTMVEVVNSTPEPDGTYRTYFLRVPPWVTTARQGVAWTFDIPAEQYQPRRQT